MWGARGGDRGLPEKRKNSDIVLKGRRSQRIWGAGGQGGGGWWGRGGAPSGISKV